MSCLGTQQSEKTEKPTRRKIDTAHKQGIYPQSRELMILACLTAVFMTLRGMFGFISNTLILLIKHFFILAGSQSVMGEQDAAYFYRFSCFRYLTAVFPVLLSAVVAAAAVTFVQTRFGVSSAVLKPDFKRISAADRIRKVFKQGPFSFFKTVFKTTAVIYIIFSSIRKRSELFQGLSDADITQTSAFIGSAVQEILLRTLILLLFISAADFIIEYLRYYNKLKMSKREIKEEIKESEQDPLIRQKMRSHRHVHGTASSDVRSADVVICSGEYAVALKYDSVINSAPVAVAAGVKDQAYYITQTAQNYNIPVFNRPDLARRIYMKTSPGQKIDPQFYYETAGILADIYDKNIKDLK